MPGRLVEWWQVFYATPSVLIALAVVGVAGVVVGTGKAVAWARA